MAAGFKEMRFPLEVSAWMVGGPEFKTIVTVLDNGSESRIPVWQYPLHKFDAGSGLQNVQAASATKTFFFRAIGRTYGFRAFDPFDNFADSTQGNLIATATATVFQMVKDYLVDGDLFRRTITKPVPGAVVILKNGVAATAAIDYTTGLVTIAGLVTGDVIAWYGNFDMPVRFDEDWLQLGQDSGGLLNFNSVKLVELRVAGTSTGTPPALPSGGMVFPHQGY